MSRYVVCVLLLLCVMCVCVFAQGSKESKEDKELAVKHSFKPPFERGIPYWEAGAGAFVNTTYVRLTPARQSRTGFLWNLQPSTMSEWEVEFEFSVTGQRNLGGDGFAVWYVEKPEVLGTVYGSTDYWVGLGVFFDTFNNDASGPSPLILAIQNDGTQRFDYAVDGASQAMASCSFDFRNRDKPSAARMKYQQQTLTLEIALHRNNQDQPLYEPCFTVTKLELGVDKYFGLTAHTGDVADNHDIVSFVTKDLTPDATDLSKVRERWQDAITQQQSTPAHQDMDVKQFQHNVLTLLQQIQGEVNMLELAQVALSDSLLNRPGMPGVAGISPPTPKGADEVRLDIQTMNKINSLIDQQNTILADIRQMKNQMATIQTQTGNRPTDPQTQQTYQSIQQLSAKLDQVLASHGRTTQDLHEVKTHTRAAAESQSGIMSWFGTILLFFVAVGVGILALYTWKQHQSRERYKLT